MEQAPNLLSLLQTEFATSLNSGFSVDDIPWDHEHRKLAAKNWSAKWRYENS